MADNNYSIPWAPLDIGPGVDMLLRSVKQKKDSARADRNEEVNRLNADINLRRVNDQIARESAEFAERQRDKELTRRHDQAAAFEHVDMLRRARKPGVAAAYGSAYGIDLREKPQEAPPVTPQTNPLFAAVSQPEAPPPELPPDPNAVDAVSGGGAEEPPPNIDPSRMVTIDEPFTIDADVPKAPPMAAAPPMPPPQAAPVAPTNRLFQAVMAGQTYDLGDDTAEPTGLGPKYDALYNRFLMEPGGEKTAFAKVMAAWEHEQGQNAAAQRTADLIQGRQDQAGNHETFLREMADKFHLTAAEQKMLRERQIAASAAAAGSTTSPVLPVLIQMKEQGASDSEIAKVAADAKIPSKAWQAPVGAITREAAMAERAGQKREALVATDFHGKQIGTWKSAVDAKEGTAQNEAFQQVDQRMRDLIEHVKKYGARIGADTQEYQDRVSMGAAVNAALRPYNKLGGTDASQRLEAEITGALGAPDHGWLIGANLKGLERILDHAVSRHDTMLKQRLRPGGGSQLSPALGGPKQGAAEAAADVTWVPVPPRLASNPKYAGKKEVSVDASGKITGSR